MKFNEDIFNQAYNQAQSKMIKQNYHNQVNNLKYYLSEKYPNCDFSHHMYLFQLYKAEVEISFKEEVLKRFFRVWKFGYPKICPIYKFIQSPTLF